MSGPMEDERNKLRADILAALSRVYTEDAELLSDKIDVCERSLMHRFTHYFMEYAESGKDAFYEGLHVDGESVDIVLAAGDRLLLCNSYPAADEVTAQYYLFAAIRQFQINPEVTTVHFFGEAGDGIKGDLFRHFASVEML